MVELFMQKVRNIYERANAQYANYLEANKWVLNPTTGTPDKGTYYNILTNDQKNIPLVDMNNKEFFQKLQVEMQENNFFIGGRDPVMIGGPTMRFVLSKFLESGGQQAINVEQFLGWFMPYFDNLISGQYTFYIMPWGSVAGYSRAFPWSSHGDAVDGVVQKGEDYWSNLTIGGADTGMFSGVPTIVTELKEFGGYQNNSGALTIDESNIDIVKNVSIYVQFGAEKAYDQESANISPIMKGVIS